MGRTPARAHRAAKLRLKLRGSMGVPILVVNTKSSPGRTSLNGSASVNWSARRSFRAVAHRSGSGNTASEASVLVSRWCSCRPTRWSWCVIATSLAYDRMSELLDALIDKRRQEATSYKQYLEQ